MKHKITDALQIVAAILLTGGIAASAAPLPNSVTSENTQAIVEQVKAPEKPVEAVQTAPVPEKVVTWRDNPNHCTEAQYIAEGPPFGCIDKPVQTPQAPVATAVAYSGSHTDLLAAAGIAPSDYEAADFIVMHEGHYDPCVINGGAVDCSYATNGGQRAYGVCQALPGSKMASAGADWATNPVTQLRWCANYATERYGSWSAARSYWIANRVW